MSRIQNIFTRDVCRSNGSSHDNDASGSIGRLIAANGIARPHDELIARLLK